VSGGGSAVGGVGGGGLPKECIAQSQPLQRTGGKTIEPANEWSKLDQVRPWKRKRKMK
jgi:hypothetical protein